MAMQDNTNCSSEHEQPAGVPPAPPGALHQAGSGEAQDQGEGEGAADGALSGGTYTGLSATYSPDDNKLRLYSMSRLDRPTYDRVKAAGFGWAPKQELFVAPMWTPAREDLLLELCGEIGDEDSSLVDRAEARADRFEDYSDRRGAEAANARRAVEAITSGIPLGQPILVGHHSERHARKDAERIQNGMRLAVQLWDTSNYWKHRAAGALANAKYKELPAVRHRRIKGIEKDRRAQERAVAECEAGLAVWSAATTVEQGIAASNAAYLSYSFSLARFPREAPASQYEGPMSLGSALEGGVATLDQVRELALKHYPRAVARAQRWIAHYDNRLTYERAMLAEQGGIAADKFDIQVGGRVLTGRGEWTTVLRVNRSGGVINSVSTNRRYVSVVEIEEIKDYQAPTAEVAASVKAATKLPPLCNFPGDGVLELTQAQWTKVYKDHKRNAKVKATETAGAHRRRQVANYIASDYPGHEAAKADRWGWTWVVIKDAKRVDPPAPKQATEGAAAPAIPAPEREISQPVPQRSAPSEFDAMREQLRQGVKVVSADQLFPTPAAIAERMVELAGIEPGQRVLEPSAGTGRLLQALQGITTPADVVAIERSHELAQLLRCAGQAGDVRCADFLAVTPDQLGERFDAVLMNPPFADAADIKHIEHAVSFLKPGGVLVAICAGGPRQAARLEPLVDRLRGVWEPLPAGSFEESGTRVSTVMLSLYAPVDGGAVSAAAGAEEASA